MGDSYVTRFYITLHLWGSILLVGRGGGGARCRLVTKIRCRGWKGQ